MIKANMPVSFTLRRMAGVMSSALFNMGQSVVIRPAAAANPQDRILLIADDSNVVGGSPKGVIAAILDIRQRYAISCPDYIQ